MKRLVILLLPLLVWGNADSFAANSDVRFFGSYCGESSIRRCGTVKIGWIHIRKCKTFKIKNIRASLKYEEGARGGLVRGSGTARVSDKDLAFVVAGAVTARGRIRGSMTVTGMDPAFGRGSLSADGLALTIHAYNEEMTIRKDQCGNTAPSVAFTYVPSSPLQWGQSNFFAASVSDAEDTYFPPERLFWRYNDHPMQKLPQGTGATTTTLPTGQYEITFTAMDSGGLSASVSTPVTVANQAPNAPVIFRPEINDVLFAGCNTLFRGQAYDLEDGFITGLLFWASDVDGYIGSGTDVERSLTTIGGHNIELTARDGTGSTATTIHPVDVQPAQNGCPPIARIIQPDYTAVTHHSIISGEAVTFVGTATDQDETGTLQKQWTVKRAGNPNPIETHNGVSTFQTTGLTASGGQAVEYEVSFKVTDSQGNFDVDEMSVFVFSTPVL